MLSYQNQIPAQALALPGKENEIDETCDGCGKSSPDLEPETDHDADGEFVAGFYCGKCRRKAAERKAEVKALYAEAYKPEETAEEVFGVAAEVELQQALCTFLVRPRKEAL